MRRMLKKKEVIDLTGLSDPTIWRRERAGDFPQRIQLSPNRVGWFEDEIEAWQESRPRGTAGFLVNLKKG